MHIPITTSCITFCCTDNHSIWLSSKCTESIRSNVRAKDLQFSYHYKNFVETFCVKFACTFNHCLQLFCSAVLIENSDYISVKIIDVLELKSFPIITCQMFIVHAIILFGSAHSALTSHSELIGDFSTCIVMLVTTVPVRFECTFNHCVKDNYCTCNHYIWQSSLRIIITGISLCDY